MQKSSKSTKEVITQKMTLNPKMTYFRQHETSLWFRRRLRRRLLLFGVRLDGLAVADIVCAPLRLDGAILKQTVFFRLIK